MTADDFPAFVTALNAVAMLYRRRIGEDTARFYAEALADDSLDRVVHALHRLGKSVEPGDRFPLPRELRDRVRGAWHTPSRNVSDRDADSLHQVVFKCMAVWEQEDGRGSARPAFERAWTLAVQTLNLPKGSKLDEARGATWKAWCKGGTNPIPRERMSAILRDAATRAAPAMATAMRTVADTVARRERPVMPTEPLSAALVATAARLLDAELVEEAPTGDGERTARFTPLPPGQAAPVAPGAVAEPPPAVEPALPPEPQGGDPMVSDGESTPPAEPPLFPLF